MSGTRDKPSSAPRDPAEGSRETIEHELQRTHGKDQESEEVRKSGGEKRNPTLRETGARRR